jgi:hypothetical protein
MNLQSLELVISTLMAHYVQINILHFYPQNLLICR